MKRSETSAYLKIKRSLLGLEEDYPALFLLAPLLGGIALASLTSLLWTIIIAVVLAVLCSGLFFIFSRRIAVKILIGVLLGAGAFVLNNFNYGQTSGRFPAHIVNVRGQLRVTTAACCGDDLEFLANPRVVRCRVLNLDDGVDSGMVALTFARDGEFPKLKYGDVIEVSGVLMPLRPAVEKTLYRCCDGKIVSSVLQKMPGFDFSNYLRIGGVHRMLYCRELKIVRPAHKSDSFFTALFALRTRIIDKLCDGLSPEQSGMLAALFFGCRQGLDRELREDFIHSGTVHIFAVSGLHVALLAMFILFMLRMLPLQLRYLLTPAILLFYVLMTGANPPALRALLMISLYCIFRAFLIRTRALNIVFLAAVLLLLYNPHYVTDVGFQYSFIIVIFLLLSASFCGDYLSLCGEKLRWIAPAYRRSFFVRRLGRPLLGVFMVCMIASFAATPLSLYHQGVFTPFALLANFVMTPVVWCLFVFSFFKFLSFGIFSHAIAAVISYCIETMKFIALESAAFNMPHTASRPALWALVIFFAALTMLLTAKKKNLKLLSLTVLFVLFGLWYYSGDVSGERVVIFSGGGNRVPALLYSNNECSYRLLFDCPSTSCALQLRDDLRFAGAGKLDALIICSSRLDSYRGLQCLLEVVKVKRIFLTGALRRAYVPEKARELIGRYPVSTSIDNALFGFTGGSGEFVFKLKNRCDLREIRRDKCDSGGFDFTIITAGGKKIVICCPDSLEPRIKEYIFL